MFLNCDKYSFYLKLNFWDYNTTPCFSTNTYAWPGVVLLVGILRSGSSDDCIKVITTLASITGGIVRQSSDFIFVEIKNREIGSRLMN